MKCARCKIEIFCDRSDPPNSVRVLVQQSVLSARQFADEQQEYRTPGALKFGTHLTNSVYWLLSNCLQVRSPMNEKGFAVFGVPVYIHSTTSWCPFLQTVTQNLVEFCIHAFGPIALCPAHKYKQAKRKDRIRYTRRNCSFESLNYPILEHVK